MENNCDYITCADTDGDMYVDLGLACNAIVHWYTLIEKMHECVDAYKE